MDGYEDVREVGLIRVDLETEARKLQDALQIWAAGGRVGHVLR